MKLTIAPASLDEIAPFLLAALRYDTTGGTIGLRDFEKPSVLKFKALDAGGAIIGGYALTVATYAGAKVVWVEGAAGQASGVDFIRSFLPTIEQQARAVGACQLAIVSRRQALIDKMQRLEFARCGTVMRKAL